MLEAEDFLFVFDENQCAKCGGKCCKGESGYIFVTSNEIQKIAESLQMEFDEFCLKFVKKVGYRYSLIEKKEKEGKGYACVFFDEEGGKCQIYENRPKQCKQFPFWECYKKDYEILMKECIGVIKT